MAIHKYQLAIIIHHEIFSTIHLNQHIRRSYLAKLDEWSIWGLFYFRNLHQSIKNQNLQLEPVYTSSR